MRCLVRGRDVGRKREKGREAGLGRFLMGLHTKHPQQQETVENHLSAQERAGRSGKDNKKCKEALPTKNQEHFIPRLRRQDTGKTTESRSSLWYRLEERGAVWKEPSQKCGVRRRDERWSWE